MSKSPYSAANELSRYGRYGDDQLVHMSTGEVKALDGIAAAFGRKLHRNPHTGLKEAFDLFDVLPLALNFIPGIGTAASLALGAGLGAAKSAYRGEDVLTGAGMGLLSSGIGKAAGSLFSGADAAKGVADAGSAATGGAAGDAAANAISTAGIEVSPELLAEGFTPADIANMSAGPEAFAAGATAAPTNILQGAATQSTPGMFGDTFTDIFGEGTDKTLDDLFAKKWALPALLGAASVIPSGYSYEEGEMPAEEPYTPGDWSRPARRVNPNYGYMPGGESRAFESGVNYGFAGGGAVDVRDLFDRETSADTGKRFNRAMGVGDMKEAADLRMLMALRDKQEFLNKMRGGGPRDEAYRMMQNIDEADYIMKNARAAAEEKARRRDIDYGSKYAQGGKVKQMNEVNQMIRGGNLPPPGYAYGGPVHGIRGYKSGGNVQSPFQQSAPAQPYQQTPPTQPMASTGIMGAMSRQSPMQSPMQNLGALSTGQGPMQSPMQSPQGGPVPIGALSTGDRNNLAQLSGMLQSVPMSSGSSMDPSKTAEQPQVNPQARGKPGPGQSVRQNSGKPGPGQVMRRDQMDPSRLAALGVPAPQALGSSDMRRDMQQEAFAMGGRVGYAAGGMVDRGMEMDDQTVVRDAIAAIMGQSQDPQSAIMMFVDRFGEEALQMLVQKVSGGGRYIEGPGDGLSDSIPATVDGTEPSALSTGEFVVPADAVSHLGNGDNKTGAKELYGMIDRLRQARTGSPTPPPAINQRGIMPA